jgi:hypothetical protein
MKLKLAACGIDCNECASYKVTMTQDVKAAELMLPWFKSQGLVEENDGAETILKYAPFCTGCWNIAGDCYWAGCNNCEIRVCCLDKQLNHCGECDDFPCDKFNRFDLANENYKKAREYLTAFQQNRKGE